MLSYQCSGMRLGTHQSSEVLDTIIQEIPPPFNPYKEEKNLLLKQKTCKNRQIGCYIFHLQQLKKKLQRKIFYLSLQLAVGVARAARTEEGNSLTATASGQTQ